MTKTSKEKGKEKERTQHNTTQHRKLKRRVKLTPPTYQRWLRASSSYSLLDTPRTIDHICWWRSKSWRMTDTKNNVYDTVNGLQYYILHIPSCTKKMALLSSEKIICRHVILCSYLTVSRFLRCIASWDIHYDARL